MAEKNTQNHIVFEEYKQRFSNLDTSNSDSQETPLLEIFNKFSPQLLLISMMWNAAYFLCQIILFSMESERSPAFYLTVGLFCTCVGLFVIRFKSETGRSLQIKNKSISSFSYSIVYIHVVLITFLSLFMEDRINGNHVSILERFPYDLYLVLSGCLIPFQFELKTLLRHRQLTIIYFIFTLGEIILTGIITGNIIHMFITSTIFTFVFSILFYVKKGEIFMDSKLKETNRITEKTFGHLESVIKVLNAGTLLFKNENLFYANEIGRSVLDKVASSLFNNITEDLNDTKKVIENIGLKYSTEDSIWKPSNLDQNTIRSIFSNILLHEDTSNIHELVNECSHYQIDSNFAETFKEKHKSLASIFQSIISSCPSSDSEDICACSRFAQAKGHTSLGIFKIVTSPHNQSFYEIYTIVENVGKQESLIELIFKETTSNYHLLNKIDNLNSIFKKQANELKTPIYSLLDSTEELKSQFKKIEDILPEIEKMNIKNGLANMTNLSSFIGFLIKGFQKSGKESLDKSDIIGDYKQIKLNILLNFSLNILQTLLSCDANKSKNVEAKLKNDIADYEVSFISDEVKVKQILLNFISNSVKYTNRGKITIRAETKKKKHNVILMIIIKDTGCGMNQEDQSKILSEQSTLDSTASNSFGSGLGLGSCKSMADHLDMKIKFNSQVGKGTEAILCITNPIINERDKFLESTKVWKMSDSNDCKALEISKKNMTSEINNNTQTLMIQEEEEVSLENSSARRVRIRRTTLINSSHSGTSRIHIIGEIQDSRNNYRTKSVKHDRLMFSEKSDVNNSMISCILSLSSDTFDVDANNKKSTRRLNPSHNFGINLHMENVVAEYDPEYKLKKCPTLGIQNIKCLFPLLNDFTQGLYLPRLTNQASRDNSIAIKSNDLKSRNSGSFQRTVTFDSKTRLPLYVEDKILIVDDQLHPRKALANLIKKIATEKDLSYEIMEECDGIDCLKTISKFPFNIRYVFIGENMNFMNGTETAGHIRKLTNAGKIGKIILVLTSADDNMSLKTKLFDVCIPKPVSRRSVQEILGNYR